MSPGATTGRPSSVKPAAPASASSAISVSSAPSWPFVIAARKPTGNDGLGLRVLDQRAEHRGRVDDRLRVRHRQDRAVAARRGGRACRRRSSPRPRGPGVRRCTCGSTNAGASTRPSPSTTRCSFVSRFVPSCGDRAAVDAHVETASMPSAGSSDARAADDEVVAWACSSPSRASRDLQRGRGTLTPARPVREQVVEDGHPHDEPRAHLRLDQRVCRVGDAPGRSRRRGSSGPGASPSGPGRSRSGRDAPAGRVLAQRGHVVRALLHPLPLHAEDVDDVGVARSRRCRARPRSPSPRSRAGSAAAARRASRARPSARAPGCSSARPANGGRRRRSRHAGRRAGRPPRLIV